MLVDDVSIANNERMCPIVVPYVGESSNRFVKVLSPLRLKQINVKLIPFLYIVQVKWDIIFN